jgi:hypothetical protein
MTSTNIAVVVRRRVTRDTAFLDPALPLEAKLPRSLHANGAATRDTSHGRYCPQSFRGTGDDRHYPRSPRVTAIMTGARPCAHRRAARPRGPVRLPSDATRIRLGELTRGHACSSLSAPEMSFYARLCGTRRRWATRIRRRNRRPVSRATARRTAQATRPIRSAIVASASRIDGPLGGRRTERVSKSEHDPVEVNPPDYCFDHSGVPVRREEIHAPSRALRESFGEANFGPAVTQVDQWQSQQPALARFKDDRPSADLSRIAPRLRRLPSCRLPARLLGDHGGWAYRRHRASYRSGDTLKGSHALSCHAMFALSTGVPTVGVAMLDQPAPHVTPRKEREKLVEYLK